MIEQQLENKTFDSVLDKRDVEIDEQAQPQSGQFQIRKNLSVEQQLHSFNCFQFDNDLTFNKHIQTKPTIKANSLVDNWQDDLGVHFQTTLSQFVNQARFVNRL